MGVPVLVVGVLDQDVSAESLLKFPAVYLDGIHSRYLNNTQFLKHFLAAAAQAAALCFIPFVALAHGDDDGRCIPLRGSGSDVFVSRCCVHLARLCWGHRPCVPLIVARDAE